MSENTAPKTFEVPSYNLPNLRERIEKLNRKVAKLQKKGYPVEPVRLIEGQPFEKTFKRATAEGDVEETIVFVPVQAIGTPPRIDGWEFVAAIDSLEGGNVLRVVPGVEVKEGELARFRDCKPECEHCKTDRHRKATYVVRKVS